MTAAARRKNTNSRKPLVLNVQQNLKLIDYIRTGLENVHVTEFCQFLGYSRQNLYKKLSKARATKTNTQSLLFIASQLSEFKMMATNSIAKNVSQTIN